MHFIAISQVCISKIQKQLQNSEVHYESSCRVLKTSEVYPGGPSYDPADVLYN